MTTILAPPPVYPTTGVDRSAPGEATIEFVIDSQGLVRRPRVISATAEPFGYAAVQAVAFWLFESPTKADRPVATVARTVISYANGSAAVSAPAH